MLISLEAKLKPLQHQGTKLFKPPYEMLILRKTTKKKGYKIIMWDVLSADFYTKISIQKYLHNVIKIL